MVQETVPTAPPTVSHQQRQVEHELVHDVLVRCPEPSGQ
jgi:hypothetical protein